MTKSKMSDCLFLMHWISCTGTQEAIADVRVECNSNEIVVSINTDSGKFTGMVYPRGLSKNSTCMGEWIRKASPVQYTLPLRGCNTMSTELVSAFKIFIYEISFNIRLWFFRFGEMCHVHRLEIFVF